MPISGYSLENAHQPGIAIAGTRRGRVTEWFILGTPLLNESPDALFRRAAQAVQQRQATVTNQFVWFRPELYATARTEWESVLGPTRWPLSWMVDPNSNPPFGGVTIRAVSGTDVEFIRVRDRYVGAAYDDAHARYLLLGGLTDRNPNHSPARQAESVFADMICGLESAGMDFSHVLRTWFFNRDILDWYPDFNRVRSQFFARHAVSSQCGFPASTGIGASNAAGTHLIASLIAVRPHATECSRTQVASPRQCPADSYGSSFSRALELQSPHFRHLFLSGTASIAPNGTTRFPGDTASQTRETLLAIQAILASRNMDWTNVVQAVAYLRHASDAATAGRILREFGADNLPMLWSNNTICRDDLLFELELQATAVP